VKQVDHKIELVVVYPLGPNAHAASHTLMSSPDGKTWTAAVGTDSPGSGQAEGPVPTLGYFAIAGDLVANPSPAPATSGGNSTVGIALIVGAVCAALIGIGLLARGRGR
jgi:hypothetical protein